MGIQPAFLALRSAGLRLGVKHGIAGLSERGLIQVGIISAHVSNAIGASLTFAGVTADFRAVEQKGLHVLSIIGLRCSFLASILAYSGDAAVPGRFPLLNPSGEAMNNIFRGYQADHSRRSFLRGTGALGLTFAAAGGARGQSASVVVINEDGSVSTNATLAANPNAAQWVSPSAFVASSLETGRIGYIIAWGGNEFGYAYTYALSGAPAGLTIDPDTGILSIASDLAVRAYGFSVIVTNREVVTNVATFPISLTILQGVTTNQTGTQILHKTYDPHSGAYGAPAGTDWTAVLFKIQ